MTHISWYKSACDQITAYPCYDTLYQLSLYLPLEFPEIQIETWYEATASILLVPASEPITRQYVISHAIQLLLNNNYETFAKELARELDLPDLDIQSSAAPLLQAAVFKAYIDTGDHFKLQDLAALLGKLTGDCYHYYFYYLLTKMTTLPAQPCAAAFAQIDPHTAKTNGLPQHWRALCDIAVYLYFQELVEIKIQLFTDGVSECLKQLTAVLMSCRRREKVNLTELEDNNRKIAIKYCARTGRFDQLEGVSCAADELILSLSQENVVDVFYLIEKNGLSYGQFELLIKMCSAKKVKQPRSHLSSLMNLFNAQPCDVETAVLEALESQLQSLSHILHFLLFRTSQQFGLGCCDYSKLIDERSHFDSRQTAVVAGELLKSCDLHGFDRLMGCAGECESGANHKE